MLHSYIEKQDDLPGEIVEYVDDGYTGTNFNRPASYRLKKMNGNVRKDGKIWNTGVALLKYFAGLNSNQNGQYGQIYAEKFTSACLICKVFYGKMKAQ